MSNDLVPLNFPLRGSSLIEASAGTGKTWTIAALYLRLVLGDDEKSGFGRPLQPSQILVMTFTRAATRELSDRIRKRLLEAARCFRGEQEPEKEDSFLAGLLARYSTGHGGGTMQRLHAAHRLALAAEGIDDAAIFTIDAWCQRMLREHAFDSGCLFDEELIASEDKLIRDAVRDYWRHQLYPLSREELKLVLRCWPDVSRLEKEVRSLLPHAPLLSVPQPASIHEMLNPDMERLERRLSRLKAGWDARADQMQEWFEQQMNRKALNGNKMRKPTVNGWFDALRVWARDKEAISPDARLTSSAWHRLSEEGIQEAWNNGFSGSPPMPFRKLAVLERRLSRLQAELEQLDRRLLQHAAAWVAAHMARLKHRTRRFGFADMLVRLKEALRGPNGTALRERILEQYPVALIDEFQDTSADQYDIFNTLYSVETSSTDHGLFLIGDPKQAIYRFRGADINSYMRARRATEGRHYKLGINFRSSEKLVQAVNLLFLRAEGNGSGSSGNPQGAFAYGRGGQSPLPFHPVQAKGRTERLVCGSHELVPVTIWCRPGKLTAEGYRRHFAELCADRIASLLGDSAAGFASVDGFVPLRPADIAILVRDRTEAAAVREALNKRGVGNVYLSDRDSVFATQEASDVLRWLQAIANPLDGRMARAAFATSTVGLPLAELGRLAADDLAWDSHVELLKELRKVWLRQGVLAMLRRFIHQLELPGRLLPESGGERKLTNLLHLAELLQGAAQQLDGEQALIRWLAQQIEDDGDSGDERLLRLESDAGLVRVVTIHKSKGLEYPLVFLPFATSARPEKGGARSFYLFSDEEGRRRLDFSRSEQSLKEAETERLREDLRLLYVALTRARHALWLGVGMPADGIGIHQSAFGYLLSGEIPVAPEALMALLEDACGSNRGLFEISDPVPGNTELPAAAALAPLVPARAYTASFDRDWSVSSYTSLTRSIGALPTPVTPLEEKLIEEDDCLSPRQAQDAPWHRFPRGARPGQFIHEQLEWLAHERFSLSERELEERGKRLGWANHMADTIAWLRLAITTLLPPLQAPLNKLERVVPEMEFWLPASGIPIASLDRLSRQMLPGKTNFPELSDRLLKGMLRGFMDLVIEHNGRYWVLDYKSNTLGAGDGDYHVQALAEAIAGHRYDVQAMIYQLALHRLLKSRLGTNYNPAQHLGGALFYFLRGIGNQDTRGCYLLSAKPALLEELDCLLPQPVGREAA